MEGQLGDSLGVERAEMLQMIEDLQRVVTGLGDVNAGVLKFEDELHRLRLAVLRAQSPKKWRKLLDVGCDVIARIAVELLKPWL